MRKLAFLVLIMSLAISAFGQEPTPTPKTDDKSKTTEEIKLDEEREAFRNAIAKKNAARRVSALKKFVSDYPESKQKNRALGLLVSGRAELADTGLRDGKIEEGIKLFKLAVKEAPEPVSDRLYRAIILQIPNNLFFRGERVAGLEVAELIEKKVSSNPKQLLALTTFYLGVENAPAAIRIAEKVIELDPETKGVYQVLGLAYRFNFNLEKSAGAYAQALETNKESNAAKISLAEMYRATGKPDEAMTLYKEVLESEPKNINALTGLTLSLFDAGNVDEAETKMQFVLIEEPNNLFLLVGAAYWYAANGNGEKAVELSQKALTIEPRYTWGYIALARGFMKMGNPIAAEKVLFTAKKFGNFPTLQYEIATTRLAAGFYKDAAEELEKSFVLENGILKTKLGGRLEVKAESFAELLSLEREASIFQPISAYEKANDDRLKKLLGFATTLKNIDLDETAIIESANEFIDGEDKMKTHRQIFVADQLLEKEKALPKVLEIAKDAVKGIQSALSVTSPSSAILANELYEVRLLAFSKGEMLNTPVLDQITLESILRGRIEQISGFALHMQKENDEAAIRLKRAISVYPKDSVWMRSTNWRMGLVLQEQDKPKDALDYFIKGYSIGEKSEAKKIILQTAYKEVYGSLDGLEEKLKTKPEETNSGSIFVKQDEPKEQKIEPTKETSNGKTNPTDKKLEDPIKNEMPKETDSDVKTVKEGADKPNIEKLPEDLNLNILDTKKTIKKPLPKDTGIEKKDRNQTEDKVRKDSESEKNKETKKANSNNVGKPVVVFQDNLSKTEKKIDPKSDTDSQHNNEKENKKESEPNTTDEVGKKDNDEKTDEVNAIKARPRFVDTKSVDNSELEKPTCKIMMDQESISIFNNGGGIGILVGVEKDAENSEITAVSSNPEDVEVVFEPEIGAVQGRAFFLIKSISINTGEYKITFDTPCGKKEIPVKVR